MVSLRNTVLSSKFHFIWSSGLTRYISELLLSQELCVMHACVCEWVAKLLLTLIFTEVFFLVHC